MLLAFQFQGFEQVFLSLHLQTAGGLVGALEAVLDSKTEVAPFRVLLQVPGSQVYSPIACGELLDGCNVHWAIATGSTLEEINQHWNSLGQNLLHTLSVFDNKDDMASFVKGKVKNLERTANVFVADTIRITTQNKEHDSSMFLILDAVLKIMEQLVDVMLRRLLDNEDAFSRFHTAGRMFSSDSSTYFASREDGCYNVVLLLREVVSMEKMEDTSLLPSPILISIRSKMAFQFIELKDRGTLVETLLERLKQVHANRPVHYDTSTNDKDMVGACSMVAFHDVTVPLSPPLCQRAPEGMCRVVTPLGVSTQCTRDDWDPSSRGCESGVTSDGLGVPSGH
ncbi:TBC1 domain family member 8 [Sciurus carolinensis]|uniref:TBC1 domain family member 8 n=1 Tax=Sciurus carolinensis TaxID=30640 RepID=A0AA41MFL9_SCICA|nr:TBC1 domain family member 8 [Sciurus carolinensis]